MALVVVSMATAPRQVHLGKRRFSEGAPFLWGWVGLDWIGLGTYPLLRSRLPRVPPLRRVTFGRAPKVTKNALPHHLVPRLGSACPNAGIAPRAAAKGHPWPSAATSASMPRCPLHNTCVRPAWFNGASRSRSRSKARARARARAGYMPTSMWLSHRYREQARSHTGASVNTKFMSDTEPGSELARDDAGTSNIFAN
ncbi:hypothetical protein PHLH4_12420 [Pseudomonas sp. St316]|nr:hypothetical protein PHLH4_12420 [Pseudomonas sp. St316]